MVALYLWACLPLPFPHTHHLPIPFLLKRENVFVTSLKLAESVHLAQPPTIMSQEEGDYGSWVHTVNFVLKQQGSVQAEAVQHKAVHLALSTLGLQSGPGFMESFSACLFPCMQLFWKAKVKLNTMTEQMCHAHLLYLRLFPDEFLSILWNIPICFLTTS